MNSYEGTNRDTSSTGYPAYYRDYFSTTNTDNHISLGSWEGKYGKKKERKKQDYRSRTVKKYSGYGRNPYGYQGYGYESGTGYSSYGKPSFPHGLDERSAKIANRILGALSKATNNQEIEEGQIPAYTIIVDPKSETFSSSPTEDHTDTAELRFEKPWEDKAIIHISSTEGFSRELHIAIDALRIMLSGVGTFSEIIKDAEKNLRDKFLKQEFQELNRDKYSRKSTDVKRDSIKGLNAERVSLNGTKYIASSNPDFHQDRFWEMIHEEKSPLIVKLNERGRNYFPVKPGDTKSFRNGELKVKLLHYAENLSRKIYVRNMQITYKEKSHEVRHIDFRAWPDFSIPTEADFLLLLAAVRECSKKISKDSPITVHCQMGLGRTGTFITAHSSLDLKDPDFPKIIKELRQQRSPQMVEAEKQYILINDIHRFFQSAK